MPDNNSNQALLEAVMDMAVRAERVRAHCLTMGPPEYSGEQKIRCRETVRYRRWPADAVDLGRDMRDSLADAEYELRRLQEVAT